jgi:hypothetical protein
VMTHSPESNFPSRSAADAQPWWWRHEDAEGAEIEQAERQEFPSRSDAETWLGEAFGDLADEGVAAVTLFEGEREVYGPMSLAEA